MAQDWAIYRVVTHEATRGQPMSDILERWTLDDLDAVNTLLDSIDDAQARAAKAQRRKER